MGALWPLVLTMMMIQVQPQAPCTCSSMMGKELGLR